MSEVPPVITLIELVAKKMTVSQSVWMLDIRRYYDAPWGTRLLDEEYADWKSQANTDISTRVPRNLRIAGIQNPSELSYAP